MNQYQFILLSNNLIILELSLEIEYKKGCNHLQPFRKYSSTKWSLKAIVFVQPVSSSMI